jgi:hypothetical protein
MLRFFERISMAFLTAVYLAATSGTLIGHLNHPTRHHGVVSISQAGTLDWGHVKRFTSQRRHLPMVSSHSAGSPAK